MELSPPRLCVPELPELWRTYYAQLRYSAGFISSDKLFGPGDEAKERFSLGAYARLMAGLSLVETECKGVWLMPTDEDYQRTLAAVTALRDHRPFSDSNLDMVVAVAAEDDLASHLEEIGQADLVRQWHTWIATEDVDQVRIACEALDQSLGNALAYE